MRSSARLLSDDMAIASLWGVLLRSWLRVLILAGLAGALTFAVLTLVPPRFSAMARLSVPLSEPQATDADHTVVAGMVDALRSRGLAQKLASELEGASDGELLPNDLLGIIIRAGGFVRPRLGETPENIALAAYDRSLRIAHDAANGAVTIEFTSTNPELSARAANRLGELYLADTGRASTVPSAADKARVAQIEKLSQEISAVEVAVEQLRGQPDPVSREQRLQDLSEAVTQAQLERGDAEARAGAVRALLDKGNVEAIPEVQSSPVLHELIMERVRVEIQKTNAERTLSVGHPRVSEMQAKLSELRWRMFREATSVADALDVEVRTAAQREAEARSRLDNALDNAKDGTNPSTDRVPEDAARLIELEREAGAKRDALAALKAQESAAMPSSAESGLRQAITLSPAKPSTMPVFPRKGPLALLSAVTVLMIGFIAVIAYHLMAAPRRLSPGNEFVDLVATARDRVEERIDGGQPEAVDVRAADGLAVEAPSADADQFAIVSSVGDAARHVAGRAAGRSGYRTLIAADGIDGAVEARDFVATLAISGASCVLVDWCPEGRGIAITLGLPTQPGINDLLAGRATFDDVIIRLPDSDGHFVACGTPVTGPAKALDADWISLILDALDEAYDHIVVVSRMNTARALFEAIEGRFDAGIMMSAGGDQGMTAAPGVFLGFEVTEISIVHMEVPTRRATSPRRLKRTRRHVMA